MCRLLVANCSADLESRSDNGGTPLHYAAFNDKPGAVECLVELGAQVEVCVGPGEPARPLVPCRHPLRPSSLAACSSASIACPWWLAVVLPNLHIRVDVEALT